MPRPRRSSLSATRRASAPRPRRSPRPSRASVTSAFGGRATDPRSALATTKNLPTSAATPRSSTESPTAMHSLRRVAARPHVGGHGRRLRGDRGNQVVGPRRPGQVECGLVAPDRPVVHQAQALVPALREQLVRPRSRPPAPGRRGTPRARGARGHASRAGRQSPRAARPARPSRPPAGGSSAPPRAASHRSGSVSSPSSTSPEPTSKMYEVWPEQPGVLHHLGPAAARLDHHLHPGPVAGLERPRGQQRELDPPRCGTGTRPARGASRRGRCRRSGGPPRYAAARRVANGGRSTRSTRTRRPSAGPEAEASAPSSRRPSSRSRSITT